MVLEALDVSLRVNEIYMPSLRIPTVFNGVPSSCFPSSTGLGSSFDVELAAEVGKALANECRAKGYLTACYAASRSLTASA
jgi:hypothetical protein